MNKVVLVTGAGRGLGAGLAKKLAEEGFDLALHYCSSRAGVEQVQAFAEKKRRRALLIQADLTVPAESERLRQSIEQTYGQLDVLVNNAGVYHEKQLDELTPQEWFEGLNTTATAVFFTTRAMLPLLRRSEHGRIVNIGDSSSDRASARDMAISYHIGKTGVWMLTRSFAQFTAKDGITVNMISPGLLNNSVGLPSLEEIPAGRYGTFSDVYEALKLIIHSQSDYLTGSNLMVSGGWNLR
jgi:3-oxoacyl-[acyl-carrier protein] reductase